MVFKEIEINIFSVAIVQYMSEESERLSSWYSLSSAKLSSYVSSIDPSPLRMIGRQLSLESELRVDITQTQNKPQKRYVKDTRRGRQRTNTETQNNKDKKEASD